MKPVPPRSPCRFGAFLIALLGVALTGPASGDIPTESDVIEFAVDHSTAEETVGIFHVQVTRTGTLAGSASVIYTFLGGLAPQFTAGKSDFVAAPDVLTFAPGESVKDILVTILDDTVGEPDEAFQMSLTSPQGAHLGAITHHTVTIHSDEAPRVGTISFAQAANGFFENAGSANIVVKREGELAGATVQYATVSGSAVAGEDFTAISGTLTFGAGETQKILTVPLINDTVGEWNETFTVTLSAPGGGAILGAITTHTITIMPDELPEVGVFSFAEASSEVSESAGEVVLTVNRTNSGAERPVPREETVHYATIANGTAWEGADYTATSGMLTFAAGETTKTIHIPITSDHWVEGDETFLVVLSSPSEGAFLGPPALSNEVTIVDDDPVTLEVDPATLDSEGDFQVAEDAGTADLTIRLGGRAVVPVSVSFQTVVAPGEHAAQPGLDFEPISGTIVFPPGVTSQTVSIPLHNNSETDGTRSFLVQFGAPSVGAVAGVHLEATIKITDEDNEHTAARASYHGIARRTDAPGWGSFTATTTGTDRLTGVLQCEGHSYRFSGRFGGRFLAHFPVREGQETRYQFLSFQTADRDAHLVGNFSDLHGLEYEFTAERDAVGTQATPVPQAGRYTATLEAALPAPVKGVMAAAVQATGTVKITGALPDGMAFTQATRISESGHVALCVLAPGRGGLVGDTVIDRAANPAIAGDLHWKKEAVAKGGYADGFSDVAVILTGAPYEDRTASVRRGIVDAGSTAGVMRLADGGFADPAEVAVQIFATKLVAQPRNALRLSLTEDARTGLFSGSFTHPDGRRRGLKGVRVQYPDGEVMAGFFPGTATAGTLEVVPRP